MSGQEESRLVHDPGGGKGAGKRVSRLMEQTGHNQFVWDSGKDTLKMINSDALIVIDPPITVSSRLWGLLKELVKEIKKTEEFCGVFSC